MKHGLRDTIFDYFREEGLTVITESDFFKTLEAALGDISVNGCSKFTWDKFDRCITHLMSSGFRTSPAAVNPFDAAAEVSEIMKAACYEHDGLIQDKSELASLTPTPLSNGPGFLKWFAQPKVFKAWRALIKRALEQIIEEGEIIEEVPRMSPTQPLATAMLQYLLFVKMRR